MNNAESIENTALCQEGRRGKDGVGHGEWGSSNIQSIPHEVQRKRPHRNIPIPGSRRQATACSSLGPCFIICFSLFCLLYWNKILLRQIDLDLCMYPREALNSEQSSCLSQPPALWHPPHGSQTTPDPLPCRHPNSLILCSFPKWSQLILMITQQCKTLTDLWWAETQQFYRRYTNFLR